MTPTETADVLRRDIEITTPRVQAHKEQYRHVPHGAVDHIAKTIVHVTATCADFLFQNRYGHRAVVLETIAAVPGMVGGLMQHLKSLRFIQDDNGWIRTLLDEAENERMHLLVYSEIAKPNLFERLLIMVVQFFFFNLYFLLYIISARTAHRVVGYFEEEAIHSYEHYLALVESGEHKNIPASELARKYWNLPEGSYLTDVIKATIADEMIHRDVNHRFADYKVGASFWK